MLGHKVTEFLTSRSVQAYEQETGRRSAGQDSEYELTWEKKDGTEVATHVSATFFAEGDVEVAFAIITDLTKLVQLKELERRHETLLGNLPGMVYRCYNDENWTMSMISQGCLKLTGYAREDVIKGTPTFENLIHPDDRQMARTAVDNALKERRPFTSIYRIITASGEIKWVWEQGTIVDPNKSPEILEGFITDYTARHYVEQASVSVEVQRNVDKLSAFYNLALDQSKKSFRSSQIACVVGLVLFAIAAALPDSSRTAVAVGGAFTELLAGGYFYMYTKSVEQIDKSFRVLQRVRNDTVAIRLSEELSEDLKNEMKMKIIDGLVSPLKSETEPTVGKEAVAVVPSASGTSS